MTEHDAAISVAIANDYEIVVRGVSALLAPWRDRVRVVETDTGLPVVSDVDVILFDTFGQGADDGVDVPTLVRGTQGRVIVFSWNTRPQLVQEALAQGAAGYVSKTVTAEDLVTTIEKVHAGSVVVPDVPVLRSVSEQYARGHWPGREHGLTAREAEVLAMIVQGLSNQEIADRTYISINSVKTYVRTAYRKLGISRRAQAVAWGMTHGFQPDRVRRVTDAEAAGDGPSDGAVVHPFGRTVTRSEGTG